jgi:hypothetical protein
MATSAPLDPHQVSCDEPVVQGPRSCPHCESRDHAGNHARGGRRDHVQWSRWCWHHAAHERLLCPRLADEVIKTLTRLRTWDAPARGDDRLGTGPTGLWRLGHRAFAGVARKLAPLRVRHRSSHTPATDQWGHLESVKGRAILDTNPTILLDEGPEARALGQRGDDKGRSCCPRGVRLRYLQGRLTLTCTDGSRRRC